MDADQLRGSAGEFLQPGETFRAVVLVSRADPRTSVPMTRAEMSPFRLRFRRPLGERRGVQGRPGTLAPGLDEHIRNVTDPRLLVLTDRRLLLLRRRGRNRFRPAAGPLWECPRDKLASATERAGRLRLTFTDGSALTLLTPSAGVQPFLDG